MTGPDLYLDEKPINFRILVFAILSVNTCDLIRLNIINVVNINSFIWSSPEMQIEIEWPSQKQNN